MIWNSILDSVLGFFEQISYYADWLFQPLSFNIPEAGGFWGTILNWLINWLNSIEIGITPIQILTIGGFALLISIGILKLVF